MEEQKKIQPVAWVTNESIWRLKDGGNCKGTVPMHCKPSCHSTIGLYHEDQMRVLAARIKELENAAKEVIEFNRQHANDQYGDACKAESWACVKVLRSAIEA